MKNLVALVLCTTSLLFNPAFAATAQQSKMASCNKDATGKTDDERKAFMKDCLSAKPAAAPAKPNSPK